MKLNIINYNPNLNQDKETLKSLFVIFENINENISTKKYIPYQNILNKISKFINMLGQSFQKDIKLDEENDNYFDETNEDDDISISSVSEYEYESSDDEIELRINEEKLIKNFENTNKIKFNKTNNRFDFEYE